MINKLIRFIGNRAIRFSVLSKLGLLNWMSDERHIAIKYKYEIGKSINLKAPKTYNEKIQWLKLYDRNSNYTLMVDKLKAKEYVSNVIGSEYIIPLIGGPYSSFDEIDFQELPDSFVLKTNHDCGGVIVCKDKNKFDYKHAKKILEDHLRKNYYYTCREWPYKNIKPCIFAEAYMSDFDEPKDGENQELTDYKFLCFDGEPKILCLCSDRMSGSVKFDYYDMEGNLLPFEWVHPNSIKKPPLPINFQKMKELARQLANKCPSVRIDFYESSGRIYFGEITFFHQGGFAKFNPDEWDDILGGWITLPNVNQE